MTDRIRASRKILASACLAHALHDGLIDALLVFLPVFQAQFGLTFGEVGALRATATGAMAAAQIPAGRLAERIGDRTVLAGGTALAGAGYLLASLSHGLFGVVAGLACVGLGASVQHPIASDLIANAYQDARRRVALGVYNFTGDIGKSLVPPLSALLITVLDWRIVCMIIAALSMAVAATLAITVAGIARASTSSAAFRSTTTAPAQTGITPFRLLVAIGIGDSAVRMAFLTFLPFLLTAKGGSLELMGVALSLIFVGGALGKFACGWLAARFGPIATVMATEVLTAVGIAALVFLPLTPGLACLPALGIALNGTSSALYGSVAELVPEAVRQRAFAIFYTATVGSGAIAPILAGVLIDRTGLPIMLAVTAGAALCILPIAFFLRPAFQAPLSGTSTSPSR